MTFRSAPSTQNIDSCSESWREAAPDWLCWVESCSSTNTWAITHAEKLQHGDTVFTQKQTAGRGQRGRVWHSPPGVLTASFVLDNISMRQRSGLSLAAGLAVIYAVEDLIPDLSGQLQLKWPNDVLIQDRKVAGVLCESVQAVLTSVNNRVVVGIGLNRCAQFQSGLSDMPSESHSAQPNSGQDVLPISLHQVSAAVPTELLLLQRLRHYLLQVADLLRADRFSKPLGLTRLLPYIHGRDVLLGREVTLALDNQVIQGRAVGINEEGQLMLRLLNHELAAFSSGRVRWR